MNKKMILDCETKKMEKIRSFQVGHKWKKIGAILAMLSFAIIFVNKFSINDAVLRLGAKYCFIIGLLLVSLSKEKIEDELVAQLRMQSYSFAFIIGVAYTLILPFTTFLVSSIIEPGKEGIRDYGDLSILTIFLLCQVGYFELLKRFHK